MTDAPERLWVWGKDDGSWLLIDRECLAPDTATKYVRSDLPRPQDAARIAELEAEVASLKADAERARADGHQNLCELEDQDARIAELTDALSRIVTPAPGVTEPAPPWAVGIARAALAADSGAADA